MRYYISQGRVETPSSVEVDYCVAVLLQIYFSICVLKIIKIKCGLTKLLQKWKGWIFSSQCSYFIMATRRSRLFWNGSV